MAGAREAIAGNPFYVLALGRSASRTEVERAGQRWLGALALDVAEARYYATPMGPQPRTEEAVRQAMAALRDPDQRLRHELWLPDVVSAAGSPTSAPSAAAAPPADPGAATAPVDSGAVAAPPWTGALAAIGWKPRCSR